MPAPSPFRRRLLQCCALLPLLAACGRKTKLAALPAGSTVLAFGDSVTYGTGAQPGEDWPTLLAAATGWKIINAGVPGDTADAGKERIRGLLEAQRPALVIAEIGGNDFLRRRPAPVVKEDVRSIVRQSKVAGVQVVLVAVPELSLLGALTRRPDDAALYAIQDQFLYGADLLVAPVIEEGAVSREVVLPGEGPWRHCWTGEDYAPGHHTVAAPIGQPPVFYRPESNFADLFARLPEALAR